jgi:hypothetical protein
VTHWRVQRLKFTRFAPCTCRRTRWPSEQELAEHLAEIAERRLEFRRTYKSRKQREQELKEVWSNSYYSGCSLKLMFVLRRVPLG